MAWRPVSHGVSLKGVFNFLGLAKIAFGMAKIAFNSVVYENEAINTI